jgi:superfamily II DNA or RNA helicase
LSTIQYAPGTLIKARGREWMVLSSLNSETIRVRPLSGSEEDQTLIFLPLEAEQVSLAQFPHPHPLQIGSHETALLLRDTLLLSLRRGAGPFRSFGQIAVEPRAYQLVPLLMALKLDTVRLLIADDVGVGKTIEGCLIARELIDRGDIEKFTVLCPPHLVDQWLEELEGRFHIRAVAVTASSAARLERGLPMGESIFSAHPYTVVSLDYIKSDKRRSEFLRACPEFVIVDEAHTCTMGAKGRHQRYELLKGLSQSPTRHMVLLTATPHSGDEQAFFKLLGLLDPDFEKLSDAQGAEREKIREKLSRHFVQRRRPDIEEWHEGNMFPTRETAELTYKLSGKWQEFLDHVLDYCAEVVASAGGDERKQRLNFWGTLALLRCASSSPVAAIKALRTRALNESNAKESESQLEDQIFDGDADYLIEDDLEPAAGAEESPKIINLIKEAQALSGQKGDPKLKLLKDQLTELIEEKFNPVVFCRYIATAHYLKEQLAKEFEGVTVEVITGEITSDERKEKVDAMAEAEQRLLIATDCLSEGVNLQQYFDAVVHYDLSWNPTRHEQREGRVDRFGQPTPVVRALLIYGENNPVDGAVLEVIIRKAESIRKELGVSVPLPDDNHKLTQALLKTVILRNPNRASQLAFDFSSYDEGHAIETIWSNAADKAKGNRSIFAQKKLKPEDVLPEWKRTLSAIGGAEDVKRFTIRALARLGAAPEERRNGFKVPLLGLQPYLRERLEQEGMIGSPLIDFTYPPRGKCKAVTRSHPLVHILADSLLEKTLDNFDENNLNNDPAVLGRLGCWISNQVASKTTVVLLRLRHQLVSQSQDRVRTLLVEEASSIGWVGKSSSDLKEGSDVLTLLNSPSDKTPPKVLSERVLKEALDSLKDLGSAINKHAENRAQELLSDHRRVREAAGARGRYSVTSLLPPDVIGVFVILPDVEQ